MIFCFGLARAAEPQIVHGATPDFGDTVLAAGDVDRDGFDDVIVGSRLRVLWGGAGGLDTWQAPELGCASLQLGWRCDVAAGDVDDDGFVDVIAGGAGGTSVYRGRDLRRGLVLDNLLEIPCFAGPCYTSVAVADLNGDDVPDIFTGPGLVSGAPLAARGPAPPRRPPLTVHLRTDGVWVGRQLEMGVELVLPPGPERDAALGTLLDLDRALHPGARNVFVVADDPVPFGETFSVLAALGARGYPRRLLGGLPAPRVARPAPEVPERPPDVPTRVRIERNGHIALEGLPVDALDASAIAFFVEDCKREPCRIVAVREHGPPVLVGSRPAGDDPTRGFIFGRPVFSARGYASRLAVPPVDGTFAPLARIDGSDDPEPIDEPIVLAANDRSVIDEVVKQHLEAIRTCYQRGLAAVPGLAGKVVVLFRIAPDGTVPEAVRKSSALNHAEVEDCIVAEFLKMQFPTPKGGGTVIVGYPFLFSPAE